MIRTKAELHWNEKTKTLLKQAPDKMMYAIARRTLDEVGSSKITPYDTGRMERSMYSSGVKQDSQGYYIGNFTNYATYVYNYGDNINWTRPTSTPKWFDSYWKMRGAGITNECVREYRL